MTMASLPAAVWVASRTLMRRLREFAWEIAFCVVGTLIVWALIDWFGGPEIAPDGASGYVAGEE